jgi:hypothetical protein
MEIKSIQASDLTRRDIGKKSHQTELQMKHEKSIQFSAAKNMITISVYRSGGY